MFQKKFNLMFIVFIILLLSAVSVAQAAPPLQEGDSSTFGETLDLDDVDDTDTGKHNLGSIMSQKDGAGEDEEDTPDGDTPDGDTPDGDTPDGDTPDGDTPDGDTPDGDTPDGDTPEESVKEHPVASALAEYFEVPYDEIMELHESGNGFGNITKAYFFAEKLGFENPAELLEAAHGSGWGNVLRGSVGNGGGKGPMKDDSENSGPPGQNKKNDDASDFVGQGNGNNGNGNGNKGGNGNGNGNKGGNGVSGQPNGNGNGQGNNGNGGGNGNKGGNGNGGGKGRGGK